MENSVMSVTDIVTWYVTCHVMGDTQMESKSSASYLYT
jgi:hypothetical protein